MRFVVAVHGTRGDVEPCAAVALELLRRGHEVRMAVPPNLVSFVEDAGLSPATPWGPDSQSRVLSWSIRSIEQWAASRPGQSVAQQLQDGAHRTKWGMPNPLTLTRQYKAYLGDGWDAMGETLKTLAQGADLILTGMTYQEVAANVAEYHDIPLATIHYCPIRASKSSLPVRIPSPMVEPTFAFTEWAYWRFLKATEDRQRHALGLPKSKTRSARRIVERGTLEIQAYDKALFPGLDEEWKHSRPFVGRLGMDLEADSDEDVTTWIADGTPPIYFGFGSTPVESAAQLLAMIDSVCTELGERALVNASGWSVDSIPREYRSKDSMKIIDRANFKLVFPRCRAVVHHGGSGTVPEGIRAGVPTVVLWSTADQPLWASRIARLKIGASQKFSKVTHNSLAADLRKVLTPEYNERVHALAARMTKPADGVALAANLLEDAAAAPRPDRRSRN